MSNAHATAPFDNLPEGSLSLLQISDTHLSADKSHRLAGLNTLNSLQQVIEHASQQVGRPDLVITTGDLVHDASREGYAMLRQQMQSLNAPVYYLPGNHDLTSEMLATCAKDQGAFPVTLQLADWSIVLLDSSVIGKVGGHLSEPQLAALDEALSEQEEKNCLVCLHHHPLKIGSAWMDNIALDNADDFFAIIDKYPQVKSIIYGHIHQSHEASRNGVQLLGAPSTCIQFTSARDKFGIDDQPPGYRWLVLLPDGSIRSGIERLGAIPGKVDLKSKGY